MALKFNSGKFTVLQVSDPQDLQFVRKTMVKMLDAAYDRVNPDLVVFTGDNILGNHLRDARFGSRKVILSPDGEYEAMKTAIHHIAEPVDRRGIPFTMIYGNHDDMNFISKEKQAEIWRGYDSFVGLDDSGDSGDVATFNLPVMSSDGKKTAFNLWFIDSARLDKAEEKCHTGVKKQAVEWYINKSNLLKEQNGGKPVPSVLFQHIPFSEMTRLNSPCKKDDYGALPLFKKGEPEKYIRLDPAVADGFLGEPIDGCEENNGEFDAIKKQGDVAAAVFGHDHRNNFIAELDGIRIFQSSAASFRCYGNRFRGVRVIEINENEPESVKTYFLTYSELCGNGPMSRLRYIWDADGEGKKKAALIAFVSAVAITSATAAAIGRKKK